MCGKQIGHSLPYKDTGTVQSIGEYILEQSASIRAVGAGRGGAEALVKYFRSRFAYETGVDCLDASNKFYTQLEGSQEFAMHCPYTCYARYKR